VVAPNSKLTGGEKREAYHVREQSYKLHLLKLMTVFDHKKTEFIHTIVGDKIKVKNDAIRKKKMWRQTAPNGTSTRNTQRSLRS
jgi:hypothetical protein